MFTKINNQIGVVACVLVFFTFNVHAISIQYSDLPTQINNDFISNGCTTNCTQETINTLNSLADLDYLSAFTINRDGQENYLIRYNLDSSSQSTELLLPLTPPYTPVVSVTPHLGYAWLELPRYLGPLDTVNTVRLYTDQITNFYDQSSGGNDSTWIFGMEADDILSGSAYITQFGNAAGPDEGTLQLFDFLTQCVECDHTATLNLVGLRYDTRGSQLFIDATDERASLFTYSHTSGEFSIDDTISLSVQAVPVPASLWLFGSGFIALFGLAKRKKK